MGTFLFSVDVNNRLSSVSSPIQTHHGNLFSSLLFSSLLPQMNRITLNISLYKTFSNDTVNTANGPKEIEFIMIQK